MRDVGGDVSERRAAGQPFRHRAVGVGLAHLASTTPRIAVRPRPSATLCAEGFVEVGADDAFRVRPRERVAGAALGDELLLADDHVGVLAALDRAAAATTPAPERAPARPAGAARPARGGASLRSLTPAHRAAELYPNGARRQSRWARATALEFAAARRR